MMAYGVTFLDGSQCTVVHPETRALLCLGDGPLNYRFVEHVRSLGKCQVIGYPAEVAAVFGLLNGDCLEEKNFAFHIHAHVDHLPETGNFQLPNLKLSPFVQVSQQTACEFHILHELTGNPRQSLLFDINPHLSFHVLEDTCFNRRRLKIRTWFEGELCQFALATRVVLNTNASGRILNNRVPGSAFLFLSCCSFRCSSGLLTSL